MARSAVWLARIPETLESLRVSQDSFVTNTRLCGLLGMELRRAQQIFGHCGHQKIGPSYAYDRNAIIAFLEELQSGDSAHYESQRRRKFARFLSEMQQDYPKLPVVAPVSVVNTEFAGLPGVKLEPGRITLSGFTTETEALELLLQLAMAISNDSEEFAQRIAKS